MAIRNSKGQFVSAKTAKKTAVKAPSKSNAVMLSINTSFPTNCQRVDSTLSDELRGKGMASHNLKGQVRWTTDCCPLGSVF
jgi:hypothetical protein